LWLVALNNALFLCRCLAGIFKEVQTVMRVTKPRGMFS
jgi:hypothetical protein